MFQRLFTSVCIALSVASISPVYAAPHQTAMLQAKPSPLKNASLGGIKFNMSEREVQRIMGKPTKRKQSKLEQCGEPAVTYVYYTYKNFQVELSEQEEEGGIVVKTVITTDRRFRTNKGIRVGDSIKKAQVADPTLAKVDRSGSGDADYKKFDIWASPDFLIETNKRGIITSISLGYESGC